MTVTVYSYPNDNLRLQIFEDAQEASRSREAQLSVEERMALLDAFVDKFTGFVGPDFQPLSDYAVSREGIYADHP